MKVLHFFLIVLLALCTFANQVESFDVPSDKIRGELKAAIADEDVIVMQAEMAWGAQEMQRYKSLRGAWPVRSDLTVLAGEEGLPKSKEETSIAGLFRGNEKPDEQLEQQDYWNYLISMF